MFTPYTIDQPEFIPGNVPLPDAVVKANAVRDKAYDEYAEKYVEFNDVLDDDAMQRAAKRDQEAARVAVHAGEDLTKLESEVDRVRKLQPVARGVAQALHEKLRAADSAVYRAWTASLPETIETVDALRDEAEAEFRAAESAYRTARARFRGLVQTTAYVRLQQAGKARTLVDAPRYQMNTRLNETESELARYWLLANGVPGAEQDA
ncbi:hypothetical protein [Streptomyces europaeiscabiei]|uniref:hypothetical protein n=1 Tax=Streptomyces europaeiscabiei TaxID=146819 RepID=UPI0029A07A3D|nr:hypothetical protein [Streptomyces europaeiscabiei]MDX2772281.1 hypothetical protein [Streptomyces europaeiscabiei]